MLNLQVLIPTLAAAIAVMAIASALRAAVEIGRRSSPIARRQRISPRINAACRRLSGGVFSIHRTTLR
jgi:hypothetical protein